MGWLIFLLNFRWHFDFCTAKIGMPQIGLGILLRTRLRRTRCFIKFPQIFTSNLFIINKLYYCSVSLFAFAQQNTVLR